MFSALASVGAWPVTARRKGLQRAHGRRSRDVAQEGDLAEGVSCAELPGRAILELHRDLAGGNGIEVVSDLAA
jgi:ActR/RegA family two-component response regulator